MQADEGLKIRLRDALLPAEAMRYDLAGGDPTADRLGRDLQLLGNLFEGE